MDWHAVIDALKDDAESIRSRAATAFAHDLETQQEMRTRAALLVSLANALAAGVET
jgi:hypothetical protein